MSADSYQRFAIPSELSPPCRQSVTTDDAFFDADPAAEMRRFRRDREKSVTIVTTVTTPPAPDLPWTAGLQVLSSLPRPPFRSAEEWDQLVFDAVRFDRDWGRQAFDLGWSTLQLFGCNSPPWTNRLDQHGVVALLWGRPVLDVTADTIDIDAGHDRRHRYRRGNLLRESVPLWVAYDLPRPP